MISYDLFTIIIAVVVSVSCGLLGVFLVIRKMSMLVDAISHTVLLGIVLAYMVVKDLGSPFILLGATLIGVLTVFLIEGLVNTKRVNGDAATGTIFPFLFSIAIILITTKYKSTHLDSHAINGNLEFAALEPLILFNINFGSKVMYQSLAVLVIIILFIVLFFKELKIVSFDKLLAVSLGFSPIIIHYLLMTLVSLTAVSSFNAVGSILVIAMMIGPAATALLISKDLKRALINSSIIAIFNAVFGYIISMFLFKGLVSISATMSSLTLITFLAVWIFEKNNGLISKMINFRKQKLNIEFMALIFHIANHEKTALASKELHLEMVSSELNWQDSKTNKYINKALSKGYLYIKDDIMSLSNLGRKYYLEMLEKETK